jgi:hypothetical protein
MIALIVFSVIAFLIGGPVGVIVLWLGLCAVGLAAAPFLLAWRVLRWTVRRLA